MPGPLVVVPVNMFLVLNKAAGDVEVINCKLQAGITRTAVGLDCYIQLIS